MVGLGAMSSLLELRCHLEKQRGFQMPNIQLFVKSIQNPTNRNICFAGAMTAVDRLSFRNLMRTSAFLAEIRADSECSRPATRSLIGGCWVMRRDEEGLTTTINSIMSTILLTVA